MLLVEGELVRSVFDVEEVVLTSVAPKAGWYWAVVGLIAPRNSRQWVYERRRT